jgi:hypothetical protein
MEMDERKHVIQRKQETAQTYKTRLFIYRRKASLSLPFLTIQIYSTKYTILYLHTFIHITLLISLLNICSPDILYSLLLLSQMNRW